MKWLPAIRKKENSAYRGPRPLSADKPKYARVRIPGIISRSSDPTLISQTHVNVRLGSTRCTIIYRFLYAMRQRTIGKLHSLISNFGRRNPHNKKTYLFQLVEIINISREIVVVRRHELNIDLQESVLLSPPLLPLLIICCEGFYLQLKWFLI